MRVLVVHNNYSSRVPSGENLAVRDEVAWLRDSGVDVHLHEAHNDDVVDASARDRVRHAVWASWSRPAQRDLEEVVERVAPDILHIHNPFPLLTGSVLWTAARLHLPVVWTVHNRRIVCVGGGNFRDGQRCTECRPGWRLPGIRHGCYSQSSAASALVTVSSAAYRMLARRQVTALAPSEYVRDWLTTTAGFDSGRVRLKHNGVTQPIDGPSTPPTQSRRFLFIGRLAPYKGVSVLLDAWERTRGLIDGELRILGDGSQADEVRTAAAADSRITWLGARPPEEMPAEYRAARAVLIPSILPETFGRVAAEALAYGRGVVTTGNGGLGEIVDDTCGWIVPPDAQVLADAIVTVARSDEALTDRVEAGRRRYERLFSPEATTAELLDIYEDALRRPSTRRAGSK